MYDLVVKNVTRDNGVDVGDQPYVARGSPKTQAVGGSGSLTLLLSVANSIRPKSKTVFPAAFQLDLPRMQPAESCSVPWELVFPTLANSASLVPTLP